MTTGGDSDARYIAASIRHARAHLGLTGTNPAVGTLLVKEGVIVGRGITAVGGRPHAETQAIIEAGNLAIGSTAYVTLEPCAHHGRTPPCAEALIAAGITRVVIAAIDPDPRVSGKGAAMLRAAGIEVVNAVLPDLAFEGLSGYLIRSIKKRPEVTLKLAVSADGMIGKMGEGQMAITSKIARDMVHLMRAQSDAIMVGSGTVLADNPALTCRLPGLEQRSPIRIIVDSGLKISESSQLVATARNVPTWIVALGNANAAKRESLTKLGCRIYSAEDHDGKIALPELLDDLGAEGISSLMVEGGARLTQNFLDENLVDRIALFTSDSSVGASGIASPINVSQMPNGFVLVREEVLGPDMRRDYKKA